GPRVAKRGHQRPPAHKAQRWQRLPDAAPPGARRHHIAGPIPGPATPVALPPPPHPPAPPPQRSGTPRRFPPEGPTLVASGEWRAVGGGCVVPILVIFSTEIQPSAQHIIMTSRY